MGNQNITEKGSVMRKMKCKVLWGIRGGYKLDLGGIYRKTFYRNGISAKTETGKF